MLLAESLSSTYPFPPNVSDYLTSESFSGERDKESFKTSSTNFIHKDFEEMFTSILETSSFPSIIPIGLSLLNDASKTVNPLLSAVIESFLKGVNLFGANKNTLLLTEDLQKSIEKLSFLINRENLILELEEIAEECGVPDWDGYDALPIESPTLELAKRFVYALPEELPLPEAAPEPDGSISLDWFWSKDRVFSLSVGKTDELSYAWIDKEDRGYGVAKFDGESIPKRVVETIRGFLS